MKKKVLTLMLALLLTAVLVACGGGKKVDNTEELETAAGQLVVQDRVSADFEVDANVGDIAITWESKNTDILTVGSTAGNKTTIRVVAPVADTDVILEATLKLGDDQKVKPFTVKVLAAIVPDTTAPVIAGLPANGVLRLEVGTESYNWLAGVTVTDNVDEDLVVQVDASAVKFDTLGEYSVEYSATDAAGNKTTVVLTVVIGDTTAPVIGGYTLHTLRLDDAEPDWLAGVTATDNYDGTVAVTVDASDVNLEVPGEYVVIYRATDNAGNSKVLRIKVVVQSDAYAALASVELPGKTAANLTLPSLVDGVSVTWASSNEANLSIAGVVARETKDVAVKLTATAGDASDLVTRNYWVTVRGSEVDLEATYNAPFSEIITLNPLMSTGVSDSDVFDYLTDTLYSGDYDWEDAIAVGSADFPGDFSKIRSDRNPDGTVEMPSIKYKQVLRMAAAFPYAVNAGTDNAIAGSFGQVVDGEASKTTVDTTWIIRLRDDLKFVDGTPINAASFEYTFQQYLNSKLNNERANFLYEADYMPLVNGHAYFLQGKDNGAGGVYPAVAWEDVGFRIVDEFAFEMTLNRVKTQYDITSYLNMINLVHKASFESGFNLAGTENNYGSVANPLVSYGMFTLANDYEDTNIFSFTRNEDHFAAWDVPFAKINGPILTTQQAIINEFEAGNLDLAGVGGEFWDTYFENPNLYVSPSNSFYRLAISIERPNDKSNPILSYKDFRHALYLATDREEFANEVQPPSQGKLGYLSNIHQVSEWATEAYASSAAFNQQLEALGLSPETGGFNSEAAKALFDAARAEAIEAGHYGANELITMEYLYYDAGSNANIANWVKGQYEEVFNAGEENKVFEVELVAVSNEELNAQRSAGDFDLIFTGMSGATFQATFGMGFIFSPTFSTFLVGKGHGVPTLEVTADISNLFFLIDDKDAYDEDALDEDNQLPEGMRSESEQVFFDALDATDGIFTGTFDELFLLYSDTPSLDLDYEGQQEDLTNITAALEKALLDQMIAVPLFSSTSAVVYSNKIVRQAHAYHLFLGWGGMSYMYKTA